MPTAAGINGLGNTWELFQMTRNTASALATPRRNGAVLATERITPVIPQSRTAASQSSVTVGDAYSRGLAPSEFPYIPEGYGPEELATRTRIMLPELGTPLSNALQGKLNGLEEKLEDEAIPGIGVEEAKSPYEVMEETKCETCEKRKYQDGSDDPGVSFKNAQHVDPDLAQSAVRGHEMEHVVRERASAEREGRKVISQSVTYHTGICPECGRFYVSGGTTRTVTAADNAENDDKSSENDDVLFDIA